MKILNLFAGIGGNRTLWGEKHEITAVEYDPNIAVIYLKRFPNDTVIVADAVKYLQENFGRFDFIWASPPCQSHSMFQMVWFKKQGYKIPDLNSLYGILLILKYFYKGKYIIENVRPWYTPLISPDARLGRHYLWCNYIITNKDFPQYKNKTINDLKIPELIEFHKIDFPWKDQMKKRQILRNCVDYRVGKYILDCAIRPKQRTLF